MINERQPIKQVVEIDHAFINLISEKLDNIERALVHVNVLTNPHPESKYISPIEWCKRCQVGRSKYDVLRAQGLLRGKRIGRKFYVEVGEVDRFYAGELTLK